jgi:cytochrome c peroxidase
MKSLRVIVVVLAVLSMAGMAVAAQHAATAEKGKALFFDPKLGTTGKSCNDCHTNGKGLEQASGVKDIEGVVNKCITQALRGKALDPGSAEMQSLVMYIKGLKK